MNLYILVEGKTERHVYPKWLEYLVPHLKQVNAFDEVTHDSFYLISAMGYPQILDHVRNAVEDINGVGSYDYFIVALDADDVDVEERIREVQEVVSETAINAELKVIVQKRCMETWFLGNRKIFKDNPSPHSTFKEFIEHYNVAELDPELMERPGYFEESNSIFHERYLKKMFAARAGGLKYSKNRPGQVIEPHYIKELQKRTTETAHLNTLEQFFTFCKKLKK